MDLQVPAEAGEWSPVVDWSTSALPSLIRCEVSPCDVGPGFIAAHAVHLSTGKILFWDGIADQYLWDIATGEFEWTPAIYNRTGCVFDEKVDCNTDGDCEEYCMLVGEQGNAKCGGIPDLTCTTYMSSATDLFCAGHVHGVDGNVIMAGGNVTGSPNAFGKREITLFDATSKQWSVAAGGFTYGFRWYPSLTQLSDGRVMILGGDGLNRVELYSPWLTEDAVALKSGFPGDLRALATGTFTVGVQYPLMFQVQLGLVFYAGGEEYSNPLYYDGYLFDSQVTGEWLQHLAAKSEFSGGSGVQYQPSKIMKSGGCNSGGLRCQPVNNTEVIDLTGVSADKKIPNFETVCPMHKARHFHTMTILPDGTVLATGGNSDGNGHGANYCEGGLGLDRCEPMNGDTDCSVGRCGPEQFFQTCDEMNPCPAGKNCCIATGTCELYSNDSFATRSAERWSPVTRQWTTLAAQANPRMYHSTALLLPDGRVLSAGGGRRSDDVTDQYNAEFFSPPYLFQGTRPTVVNLPGTVKYGIPFSVDLGNMASDDIDRVTLVRLASVTHGFDMEQRFFELSFSRPLATSLRVEVPLAKSEISPVPAGWYMLFVLADGVPSVGEYIRVLAD